jgi:hypothetical protein
MAHEWEEMACCRLVARSSTADGRCGLAYVEQFHFEDETRIGGNRSVGRPHFPVPEIGRDRQASFSSNPHPFESLIPAANHVARAEPERERLAADRRVKLLAFVIGPARVKMPSGVVHCQLRATAGRGATAFDQIDLRESGRRRRRERRLGAAAAQQRERDKQDRESHRGSLYQPAASTHCTVSMQRSATDASKSEGVNAVFRHKTPGTPCA